MSAYFPLPDAGVARRRDEDQRFRRRVDLWLRRVLLDDEYQLFAAGRSPLVVALPSTPDDQLAALHRHVQSQ
jgi:hypothetical protein